MKEINKLYAQTIQSVNTNRPFSSIIKIDNTIVVDLVLLPNQVIAFPQEIMRKITWPEHLSIQQFDHQSLRYYFATKFI